MSLLCVYGPSKVQFLTTLTKCFGTSLEPMLSSLLRLFSITLFEGAAVTSIFVRSHIYNATYTTIKKLLSAFNNKQVGTITHTITHTDSILKRIDYG